MVESTWEGNFRQFLSKIESNLKKSCKYNKKVLEKTLSVAFKYT